MSEETGVRGLLARMEKRFGRGALMEVGSLPALDMAVTPTGSVALDAALGVGGLPVGRVVEIFGPESSGKTTLTLHAIAACQRAGGRAVFVDAEHALDLGYASRLGVDTDRLLLSQPDSGEMGLEIAEAATRTEGVGMVVVDSVAALTPQAELDGEMGDPHMGLQARLMSQALRKLTAAASRHGATVVFINQLRTKIGVTFGNPETTTGGNALKFYASLRLEIRRCGAVKSGEEVIGNRTRVKVVKNKLAAPFRRVEFDILYGEGICPAAEALELGLHHGLVSRSGAWYAHEDERLGQGRERARVALRDDSERLERLMGSIRSRMELDLDGSKALAA